MFHSAHYAGEALCAQFRQGEAWTKVFGPVLIYLNSLPEGCHHSLLWNDAKQKVCTLFLTVCNFFSWCLSCIAIAQLYRGYRRKWILSDFDTHIWKLFLLGIITLLQLLIMSWCNPCCLSTFFSFCCSCSLVFAMLLWCCSACQCWKFSFILGFFSHML